MIRQMGAFVNGKVSLGLCWRTAAQPKVAVPHLSGTGFAGHLRSCRRPVSAAWQPSRAENSLACKPVGGLQAENWCGGGFYDGIAEPKSWDISECPRRDRWMGRDVSGALS